LQLSNRLSRRSFVALSAAAAGAASSGAVASTGTPSTAGVTSRAFPAGFLWGSATAAYQVEGAVTEAGRGPSIWDTFAHTPGKTRNGDTGDIADDSYHRYPEDIALMRELGLKAGRFSVAWSRIFPSGRGKPEARGIDHYRRYAEALRGAGIEPYCTLYHWDLPQALQDRGGWQNRDTAQAFADYAGYVAHRLSDVIANFMTMNEIRSFIELGYGNGAHAPGLQLGAAELAQARHHAVLGHGLAVQAIRASASRGTRVGSAENVWPALPVFDAPEHVAAARTAMREENAGYLTVMRTGHYTDAYLQKLGAAAPVFTAAELQAISSPVDFQGLNLYQPSWIRAANTPLGYAVVEDPASYPHMASPWLTLGPEILYWVPRLANEVFDLGTIYITENGASSQDTVAADGNIYDTDRVMYLRNCLGHLLHAVAEGIPVRGYFLWSLLDNFEWSDGYDKRFGITYVDFETQRRTPKLSSLFYKEVVRRNALA
jgi:beta-glucosidase